MTLTEAAACGTPAIATRIPGHLDAIAGRGQRPARRRRSRHHRPSRGRGHGPRAPRPVCGPALSAMPRSSTGASRRPASCRPWPTKRIGTGPASLFCRSEGVDQPPPAPPAGSGADVRARRGDLRPAAAHQARQGQRRHQVVPVSRPRPDARSGRVHVGPEHRSRHGHPPEHRLPVADRAVLLARRRRWGCPTGSPNACGSGRSCSSPALGVRYLLRTLGRARAARHRGDASSTRSRPYMLDPARPASRSSCSPTPGCPG